MPEPEQLEAELITLRDWLRLAVSRFNAAGLVYGHGTGNALDEAAFLILSTLHLPIDQLDPWLDCRLLPQERHAVREVIESLRALQSGEGGARATDRRRGWNEILAETPAEVAALVEAGSRRSATRITGFSRGVCVAVLRGIYRLKVEGIDVGVNYRHDLGRIGHASLEFTGSYLSKYVVDNGGLSESFDCAGLHGFQCFDPIPQWRHNLRLTWEGRQGISVSGFWRYTGKLKFRPYPDFNPDPSPKVSPQSYFDLATIFRVEPNYSLRLGVNNIFDKEPPIVIACNSAQCNGNTLPQWYDPLGRYFFAGFTLDF